MKSPKRSFLFVVNISILFFSLWPSLSYGKELPDLTLEGLLNVPIIAASAMEEKPSDSAATAYVVSAETIRDRGYTTLIELLEDIPQIEIAHLSGNAHENTLSVQGVNGDRRFQIMIDGVRVSPVTGNRYPFGRQFSLRNARQVEIILGPMSALYGADVFTGLINIVTQTGKEMEHDELRTGFGSNNTRDFSLTAGKNFERNSFKGDSSSEGGSLAITAHKYSTNGPSMPDAYPSEYSWYNNEFQSGRMLNSPGNTAETVVPFRSFSQDSEASFLHGRFNHKNFELGLIAMTESNSSSMGYSPAFALYDKDAIFKTNYTTLYGKHTYSGKNDKWKLQSQLSHQVYEIDPQTRYLNYISNYKPAYKYALDKSTSLEERLSITLPKDRQLLLGLSYQRISSLPWTGDLPSPYDPDRSPDSQGFIYPGSDLSTINPSGIPQHFNQTDYTNFGGYAQLQLPMNSICHWTLGARYDRNSLYGSTFNPRIGLVLKPNDKVNVKLLYGTAFMAPPPDKVYQDAGSFKIDKANPGDIRSNFFHIPNPDLKPEKIRSTQSEIAYTFNESRRLTLNVYDSRISDIQQLLSIGSGTYLGKPVRMLETAGNRGNARSYGGTLRLDSLQKYKRLEVNSYLAFTYSNGDLDGEMLPYSARTAIKAGCSLIQGRWTFSPRFIHQGRSYSQEKDSQGNYTSSPPFSIMNLFVKYRHSQNDRFVLSPFLNITNLTDARYYNPNLAGAGGFTATPQEPRCVTGGVTVEF
ncbi:MAG: TonB-dependent receptor [Candidatus Ozemobacteraceae bacterium]